MMSTLYNWKFKYLRYLKGNIETSVWFTHLHDIIYINFYDFFHILIHDNLFYTIIQNIFVEINLLFLFFVFMLIFVSYRCRFDNLCCAITRKLTYVLNRVLMPQQQKFMCFYHEQYIRNKNTRHSFEHTNMNKFNHTNTRHKSNHQRFTLSLTSNTNTHKKNM